MVNGRGRLGRLAAWHLPGGPIGLASTSNVEADHSEGQSLRWRGKDGLEQGEELKTLPKEGRGSIWVFV